ncbi:MAG TPA: hypothetical protein VL354_16580 [Spirochaetia bacterium]|nr:hypothetical protein [Spirochaetia bacterium]
MRPLVLLTVLLSVLGSAVLVSAESAAASLQSILEAPASLRDDTAFSLFRWDRFPSILLVDTPDFRFQDRMFSRLAFFLEKRDNNALEKRHGWNAHDYGPEGLASFFNAAQLAGFELNREELTLRDLALQNGVIEVSRDRFSPGTGGVLSISRSSSSIERRLLLTHESFHGIFFASPEYREFCFHLWDSMSPGTRAFFKSFLDELGYDADYRNRSGLRLSISSGWREGSGTKITSFPWSGCSRRPIGWVVS